MTLRPYLKSDVAFRTRDDASWNVPIGPTCHDTPTPMIGSWHPPHMSASAIVARHDRAARHIRSPSRSAHQCERGRLY